MSHPVPRGPHPREARDPPDSAGPGPGSGACLGLVRLRGWAHPTVSGKTGLGCRGKARMCGRPREPFSVPVCCLGWELGEEPGQALGPTKPPRVWGEPRPNLWLSRKSPDATCSHRMRLAEVWNVDVGPAAVGGWWAVVRPEPVPAAAVRPGGLRAAPRGQWASALSPPPSLPRPSLPPFPPSPVPSFHPRNEQARASKR